MILLQKFIKVIPMSKVLSNENTHGTENRGPVRIDVVKE